MEPRYPMAELVDDSEDDLEVVKPPPEDDEELYAVVQPLPRHAPRRPESAGIGPIERRPRPDKNQRKRDDGPLAGIPSWVFATVAGVLVGVPVFGLTAYFMSGARAKPDVENTVATETLDAAPVHRGFQRSKPDTPVVVAKNESPEAIAPPQPAPAIPPPAPPQAKLHRVMTTAEIVAECEPSICQVVGRHKSGTGFLVRQGVLATNSHVIEGENIEELEIRFPSAPGSKQGPFAAKLLYQDQNRDIAFLIVETPLPPLRVARTYRFLKGEDVTVIGSPGLGEGGGLMLENAVSRGVVSSRIELDGHEFLQLGISINHGNSGGPVLDSRGEVIGIATAIASKQEGLAFCVPVVAVRDALTSIDTGKAGPPPTQIAQGPVRSAPQPVPEGSPPLSRARPSKPNTPGHLKPGVQTAPALAYGWIPGETYVYKFRVVYDCGPQIAVLEGTSVYQTKEADDAGVAMTHGGWIVGRVRDKSGKLVDGTLHGPTTVEQAALKVGRKGDIFELDPKTPMPLLGDLSMFLIEPLPDGPELAWNESRKISLDSITRLQTPGSGGGIQMPSLAQRSGGISSHSRSRVRSGSRGLRGRPSLRDRMQQERANQPTPREEKVIVVSHPGQESTFYAVKSVTQNSVTIENHYQLTTEEKVDGVPQLTIDGSGTLTLDINTNLPTAYDYQARITEIDGNVTVRIPVTVQFRLLKGEDRVAALHPPTMPLTAMNPCSTEDVQQLLAKLRSANENERRDAAGALMSFAPLDARRVAVVKGLAPLLESTDGGTRAIAYRGIGLWGVPESIDILLAHIDTEQDFGVRDGLFEALGRLQPSPKSFGPLIARLGRDPGAERALRAAGPAVESVLLQTVVNGEADIPIRLAACKILQDCGSMSSVSALESIVAMRQWVEVGRFAADALKNVEARSPDENEIARLIADLSSPDGRKLGDSTARLALMQPIEARRTEIARALENASRVPDTRIQENCYRALGVWGDAESVTFILARLNDPNFRVRREAIDTIQVISPGDPRLVAAIGAGFDQNPREAMEALVAMGSAAEPQFIRLLQLPEIPGFNQKDIINRLNAVGTRACIPAIEKKKATSKDGFLKGDADKAIAAINARAKGNGQWLKTAIADLKSSDDNRRRDAFRLLSTMPPTTGPNAEVTHALQLSLDDPDFFSREAFLKAIELWADDSIVSPLAKRVSLTDYNGWEIALVFIAKSRPDDPATIDLVCSHVVGDRGDMADPALKLLGVRAEKKLLSYATGRGTSLERTQALRALGIVGSPASLDSLRELAKFAAADQLANIANDALNAIKARK